MTDRVRVPEAGDLLMCVRWRPGRWGMSLTAEARESGEYRKVECHRCRLTLACRDLDALAAGALPTCEKCIAKLSRRHDMQTSISPFAAERAERDGMLEEFTGVADQIEETLRAPNRAARRRRPRGGR